MKIHNKFTTRALGLLRYTLYNLGGYILFVFIQFEVLWFTIYNSFRFHLMALLRLLYEGNAEHSEEQGHSNICIPSKKREN